MGVLPQRFLFLPSRCLSIRGSEIGVRGTYFVVLLSRCDLGVIRSIGGLFFIIFNKCAGVSQGFRIVIRCDLADL